MVKVTSWPGTRTCVKVVVRRHNPHMLARHPNLELRLNVALSLNTNLSARRENTARLMAPLDSRLEPPRNRQEPPRGSSLEFESARGPLSEPARVAKGLESARRPLFEPPRAGCKETRAGSGSGSGSRHPRARTARAGSPGAQHYSEAKIT